MNEYRHTTPVEEHKINELRKRKDQLLFQHRKNKIFKPGLEMINQPNYFIKKLVL